jgi:ABC-type oligopeptide transport system substrate-binding subunit
MHTNFLSATVLSLLAVSISAAPTAVVSTPQSNIQQAHLPGSPHGSSLHPSLPKEVTQSSSTSSQDLGTRSLNVDEMKELIVEIKRSDDMMNNSQDQETGDGKGKEGENHATYMLGSPISFPARGGQGGRKVA